MTKKQRLKRINRLVTVRERDRDSARGELAEATRDAESAKDAHEQAASRWEDQADEVASVEEVRSAHEFAQQRSHLNALRREVDRADRQRQQAEAVQDDKRGAATAAQQELRKMEIWSETQAERIRVDDQRRDQKTTDEIAARIVQARIVQANKA